MLAKFLGNLRCKRWLAGRHVNHEIARHNAFDDAVDAQDHLTHVSRKTNNRENNVALLGNLFGRIGERRAANHQCAGFLR